MVLICKTLSPLHPRMLLFGWNWPIDSGEEDFKISSMVFKKILKFHQCILAFSLLSPLGKRWSPFYKVWTNFISDYPRMLCAKLVEIGSLVLEKILNFINVFLLYHNYLPLEKGKAFNLNNLEILKMWKVYRQTDRQMDDGQQAISSFEL